MKIRKLLISATTALAIAGTLFAFGTAKIAHAIDSCPLYSSNTRSFYFDNVDDGTISLYFYYENDSQQQCADGQVVVNIGTNQTMVKPVNVFIQLLACQANGTQINYMIGNEATNLSTPRHEFSLALQNVWTNFAFSGSNLAVGDFAYQGLPPSQSLSFYGPGGHLYSTDNGNIPSASLSYYGACGEPF
jgi:hypothetical protein